MICKLYAFLSRMFIEEPPVELAIDMLNKTFFSNLIPLCVNREMEKGLNIIKKFSERFSNVDELIKALSQEYTELFLVPPKPPVSLYESHYSNKKTIEILEMLKNFYRKAGFRKSEKCTEREDHLALQLEFMHILCENENELKREFLEHLNLWVPEAMDEIINSSKAEFYRGIAYLTKGLLKLEV